MFDYTDSLISAMMVALGFISLLHSRAPVLLINRYVTKYTVVIM